MIKDIRNIKSIQVFHTASTLESVTLAANTLSISQSSVSYHIKKLEKDLGVTLFRRTARGLEMTEAGQLLAKHVDRGFNVIQEGLTHIHSRTGSVKVALLPMFSSRWLSPRLQSLLEQHPDLQLSIQNHNNHYAHMSQPAVYADVGIQWGRGRWSNFDVTRLWQEKLVVVCSPQYLKANPINKPDDLLQCKLLHVDDTRMWDEWFAANASTTPVNPAPMILQDRHFQLSSTINGLGISLFASWLVEGELERGELINPFKTDFDTGFAYHLIVPKSNEPPPAVKQFCDWMLDTCLI